MPVILDPTSQNYKRTAIHCFFKAGIEASDVVKKLDETFPATTAQEVTSWFNRFKEGNLEIGEQISSIVLKREIHDSGVADDQPPARVNPADVKREVEEDGTRPNNQQLFFRSNPMQQTKGGFQLNQSPPIVQRPQDQAPMIPMHRFHIDGGSAWNWPPSRVHVMGEMQLPVPRNTPPIAKLPVERSIEGNVRNSLSVSIRLDVDCVTLQLKRPDDSQTTMDFTKRTGNRCEIDITGTPTNIVRNWYIAEALREFKKILRFHGMRFTSLAITSAEDERDRVAFMEIIGKTFQKLTEKLYVYELEIGVNKKSEMFPILEKVHVGPLKRFSLSGRSDINERIYLEDTPSLALHVPHLRFLHWQNLENDIPLQYFTDLISYQGHQRTISRAQVALYKNKICQSEQFVESIIYGNISEDLVATLKPFDQPEPYDTSIGSWVTTDRHTIRIYFKFDPNALQFQKSTFKIR
ncbi:Protein CBG04473 [Caenorhabditis briggsae]|uniref:Protein CBG04473 n=1 Tax=Caenorhabditis briggsae TaxID=6238 RepID=B0K071_CAEBR|nr:Protein CBG04473 [Caenorhabditis briggsae]CAP25208.4 Protein CBG04473 [Caenorhabditis briggsae]